jgi:hypothetical protein
LTIRPGDETHRVALQRPAIPAKRRNVQEEFPAAGRRTNEAEALSSSQRLMTRLFPCSQLIDRGSGAALLQSISRIPGARISRPKAMRYQANAA